MRILISNDDGISSPGIQSLAKVFADLGEVTVVAPHRERSTAGHSLTLHKPLRVHEIAPRQFATTGTPADCIYLGIHEILKGKPDLILSGINTGANLGTDIYYSGTVAAAREGALMNVKSYAFSLVDLNRPSPHVLKEPMRFEMAARFAREVVEKTHALEFPRHSLLNVNIPNLDESRIRGLKIARQGFRYYSNEVSKRIDPRGKDYYWIGGAYAGFEKGETTDCHLVEEGYVSIVPLNIDCTHNEFYATLEGRVDQGQ